MKCSGVWCAAVAEGATFSDSSIHAARRLFLLCHAASYDPCELLCSSCKRTSSTQPSKATAQGGGLSCPNVSSMRLCVTAPEQNSRYPSSRRGASASPSAMCVLGSRLGCSETCTTGILASGNIRASGDQQPKSKARSPSKSQSKPPAVSASAMRAAASELPGARYSTLYRQSANPVKSCAVLGCSELMILMLLCPSDTHRAEMHTMQPGLRSL
mmetsp:Transcript_718/g.1751  ORF Transcript_718/g.1751 Transcript_718/m.1751 type:complete len:214 (-) Transcript_718:758-1399(-)